MDITGVEKAAVLAALYNNSAPQGMGFLQPGNAQRMTLSEAREWVTCWGLCVDYVRGRPVKVDVTGDAFDSHRFDRDNGSGKAAQVVAHLRDSGSTDRI